jgi:hypothetical protein
MKRIGFLFLTAIFFIIYFKLFNYITNGFEVGPMLLIFGLIIIVIIAPLSLISADQITKMKQKRLITLAVMGLIIIFMLTTTPNEAKFKDWAHKKHRIICVEREIGCKKGNDKLIEISSSKQNLGIYLLKAQKTTELKLEH